MSTILFNSVPVYSTIGSGAANNLFIGAAAANNLLSGGGTTGDCILTIYKGAIPDANGFIDRATRDSDILLNFNLPAYNTTSPVLGSGYRLPYAANVSTSTKLLVGISQTNSIATQSGLATWFWLGRNVTLNNMTNNVFIIGQNKNGFCAHALHSGHNVFGGGVHRLPARHNGIYAKIAKYIF